MFTHMDSVNSSDITMNVQRLCLSPPGYFNQSLWDTLSGEFYRSFTNKRDYYHIFDFWRWDEEEINNTLLNEYDWEKAPDTSTTWRIGDGTAALYNYIYYTVAGFTEHDTFRSNQIREGDISRDKALELVLDENRPRYQKYQMVPRCYRYGFCRDYKCYKFDSKVYTFRGLAFKIWPVWLPSLRYHDQYLMSSMISDES